MQREEEKHISWQKKKKKKREAHSLKRKGRRKADVSGRVGEEEIKK